MTRKDKAAWSIAIFGVGAEVFLATLDFWFDIPHLFLRIAHGGKDFIDWEWRK